MSGATGDREIQRFSVTSGRVLGTFAVAAAVGVVLAAVLDAEGDPSYAVICVAVFFGTLAWSAMLRPRLELDDTRLVMRNMLETVTLPLAAIESVSVRQVLVVFAGDKRYTSTAVGRTRRQLHRDGSGGRASGSPGAMMGMVPSFPTTPEAADTARTSYGLFVEERIRSRVADALAIEGIKARSTDQGRFAEDITRSPAVAEIALLAVSLVVFVVLLLV